MSKPELLIFLDTCVLIDMLSVKDFAIINELLQLVESEKICLVIPKQVEYEWHKNKKTNENQWIKSIQSQLQNIDKIGHFFDESDRDGIKGILNKYNCDDECKEMFTRNISKLDNLIEKSVVYDPSYSSYMKTVEYGLGKKAPFINKNSTADALIFFTALEYLKNIVDSNIKNKIFVSSNISDFCQKKDSRFFHPDLKIEADKYELIFSKNLGLVLNEYVEENMITEEEIIALEENSRYFGISPFCPNCGRKCNGSEEEEGKWLRSKYSPELSWHIICPNCGTSFDTGDFYM